jgi:hypothetical protein
MKKKLCKICNNDFIQNSNRQKYCSKSCLKLARNLFTKEWKETHKKEVKIYKKIYNEINKEQIKNYYKNHKNEIKEYRKINKDKIKMFNKEYYKLNKIFIIRQHNKYQINKRKIDINFRLYSCLSKRIRDALKCICKSKRTTELLGCSVEELKAHLSSKFTKGMSFKNYGKWHIDHIKPCAKFDLSKASEQYKCFHYTNLQPLWAKDNLEKSDKF